MGDTDLSKSSSSDLLEDFISYIGGSEEFIYVN